MARSATSKFVELEGLRFHYRDWGGRGRAVVLLHGLGSTCRIWDLVAPLLSSRFRVLALDQRGHGETDGPDGGYDFDTVVGDLRAFLQLLGMRRPVLIGHSWGGNVALHYAVSHSSEHVTLVLVDGGTIELSRMRGMATWEQAQGSLAPPDFSGMTWGDIVDMLRGEMPEGVWSPQVEAALLSSFYVDPSGEVRANLSRSNHLQVVRALWEHKPSRLFARVKCPVLVVSARCPPQDEHEALFMEAKRQLVSLAQDLLADVQVLWMDDTIHDIPLHRPEELAQAIVQFCHRLPDDAD